MESAGAQITLRPVCGTGPLTKEQGVWVFHSGEPLPASATGFFDTSALVAVFYGTHIHHQASIALFIQFDKSTRCRGAQSLAEVYSTLTRMPGKHRISGEQAMLFIGSIREQLSIIALNRDGYAAVPQASSALGIVGENL